MSQVLVERYTMGRLRWIAATAGIAALVALAFGHSEIAWGAVCATPIGMLNYYLMVRAMRPRPGERPQAAQARVLKYSLLRMFLSAATLFVAFGFGVYFMLGSLIGVTSEMFTYMGDTVRLIRSMRGEK